VAVDLERVEQVLDVRLRENFDDFTNESSGWSTPCPTQSRMSATST